MESMNVTDINALLEPISDENPTGEDLSFSAEFDAVQEARRSDDDTLEQGEWVTDLKVADWPRVLTDCTSLLQTRSKDLRLAAWLAEADTRVNGFEGLANGYTVLAELCNQFWDELHPLAEDGDQELRIGNLSWLLSQSVHWIRAIPLTDAPQGRFNALDLDMAQRAGVEASDDTADDGRPTMAQIEAARAATSFDFYQDLNVQLPRAREALQQLENAVDARLGLDGPGFSSLRDVLDKVVDSAARMANSSGVTDATDAASSNVATEEQAFETSGAASTQQAPAPSTDGRITNRREALTKLQEVADFFRRTEPHSPVAYLADRAAHWGNMPLHVWLRTVLKDDNPALEQLQELLGVDSGQGDGTSEDTY